MKAVHYNQVKRQRYPRATSCWTGASCRCDAVQCDTLTVSPHSATSISTHAIHIAQNAFHTEAASRTCSTLECARCTSSKNTSTQTEARYRGTGLTMQQGCIPATYHLPATTINPALACLRPVHRPSKPSANCTGARSPRAARHKISAVAECAGLALRRLCQHEAHQPEQSEGVHVHRTTLQRRQPLVLLLRERRVADRGICGRAVQACNQVRLVMDHSEKLFGPIKLAKLAQRVHARSCVTSRDGTQITE